MAVVEASASFSPRMGRASYGMLYICTGTPVDVVHYTSI